MRRYAPFALTKFLAAALTGSSAMWSEGIHSMVDSGNQVMDELDALIKTADRRVKRVFIESQNTCAPA